jgi:hypothetical protein
MASAAVKATNIDFTSFYSFIAYCHAASVNFNTESVYPYDTVVSDPSGGFNTTNHTWTVPSGGAGRYDIYSQIQLNTGFTGTFFLHLQVNGTTVKEIPLPQSGGFGGGSALFQGYSLNVGDVIRITGVGNITQGATLASTYTQFSARLVPQQ